MTQVIICVPNNDLPEFNALVEEYDIALNCVGMSLADQRYEARVHDSKIATLLKLKWGGRHGS